MLTPITLLLLLHPAPQASWPQTVVFDCQFSQASHIARRGEEWSMVTDLGGAEGSTRLTVVVPSGVWSLRGDHHVQGHEIGGRVEAGPDQFSLTVSQHRTYDVGPELPKNESALLGTDAPVAAGVWTWTWFGGPQDEEAAMVRTFVSDRLVTTETGKCQRAHAG